MSGRRDLISIVTPAFNEEENLSHLAESLDATLGACDTEWEWIIVDDSSQDGTWRLAMELAAKFENIKCVRMARNSGSHVAWKCGLSECVGDAAVLMAADLQDPPELIEKLIDAWNNGAQAVFAIRKKRFGEKVSNLIFSGIYYWLVRRILRLNWISASGTDFILIDRRVVNTINRFTDRNVHLFALIAWMGFRQVEIPYDKQARSHGKSGWTFNKKIKLAVDTVIPFSYAPIRFMSLLGILCSVMGMIYAAFVFGLTIKGIDIPGWASLMIIVLVMGGFTMTMLGVLGEYIWRIYDEVRNRPLNIFEDESPNWGRTGRPLDRRNVK